MEDKINDPWGWITTHQYSSNNLETEQGGIMDKEARGEITDILLEFLVTSLGDGAIPKEIARIRARDIIAKLEQLGYRKPKGEPPLLNDELNKVADNPQLLEIGRKAIEDILVEWRDNRLSEFYRGNGLVIKEKDGKDSNIIRFGPEDALRIGIRAIAKHLSSPSPKGIRY